MAGSSIRAKREQPGACNHAATTGSRAERPVRSVHCNYDSHYYHQHHDSRSRLRRQPQHPHSRHRIRSDSLPPYTLRLGNLFVANSAATLDTLAVSPPSLPPWLHCSSYSTPGPEPSSTLPSISQTRASSPSAPACESFDHHYPPLRHTPAATWRLPPSPPSSSGSPPPSPQSLSSVDTVSSSSSFEVDSNGSNRAFTKAHETVLMTQERTPKMASARPGERLGQSTPSRPAVTSHHSSSVPSTPFQQPRDMAFRSDSPSPHRTLGGRSPQSVASEMLPPRAKPQNPTEATFCKFESGAEIRKRRIPYTEGGNEELPPPSVEPKKSLEPHEEDKLSGDMRELYDRILPSGDSEERRSRLVKKLERILNEKWPGHKISVNIFGSSGNLLSSDDSDVDICITTPLKALESMHAIADLLDKNGMEKVVCRASAKVPIVKCWDPELQLSADMNVNNPLALENTRMIRTYVQLDDRVRPLAKIIKYWTKRRYLNDAAYGGTISSYTWICMILSFLQRRNPPILPSLQKTQGKRRNSEAETTSAFADDIDALKGFGDANKESLAQLLFHFFRHYGYEFDYAKHVVSVREGRLVTREEKGWHPSNYQEKEARNRLCVEEPFTINRNLGNSADDYAWNGIHKEIRRTFDLLADGCKLEEACEEYVFPLEEKPIFQRPTPKPAPILRRSASQSGRPSHEQGSHRSRKSNRNASAQRTNNRRASSGATFAANRLNGLPFSPPMGTTPMDYFAAKGNLHDQLFQQYQYLQAQTDALRSQLVAHHQQTAQAQAQAQNQGNGSDISSPPQRSYTSGLSSPRFMENSQNGSLLPGYLFHYPTQYPSVPNLAQNRRRDGSFTGPSSPSLNNSVPNLRRQAHRPSAPDTSPGSTRSQSQPGRSLPHPITLQQQVHPGYDVSGALPMQHAQNARGMAQNLPQGYPGLNLPFSPLGIHGMGPLTDKAIPKEYVGYYINQSPAQTPQMQAQAHFPSTHGQMPPLTLRDPPQRSRRVTPELPLPMPNGRHNSRSPSPLGDLSNAHAADHVAEPEEPLRSQSPLSYESSESTSVSATQSNADMNGPVIVNGSNTAAAERLNGYSHRVAIPHLPENMPSRVQSVPAVTNDEPTADTVRNAKDLPRLNFAQPPVNGGGEQLMDPTSIPTTLLSPVAEQRTPSPTRQLRLGNHESPTKKANGWAKVAQNGILTAEPAKEVKKLPSNASPPLVKHERKVSAPNLTVPKASLNGAADLRPTTMTTATGSTSPINPNPWQEATGKRGHKKSKSNAGQRKTSGQQMPANESERKGG